MEEINSSNPDGSFQDRYRSPTPVTVPRSQYANNNRSSIHQPNTSISTPRYFSSPFRAPLNHQARQESYVHHQRSRSNAGPDHGGSQPVPQHIPNTERDSYTFFEPNPVVDLSIVPRQPKQVLLGNDKANSAGFPVQQSNSVVRQASIGHKARPALMEVRRSDSSRTTKAYPEPHTPPLRPGTIEALNAAIAAASKDLVKEPTRPRMSRHISNSRLPYDSPSSTYSQDFHQIRKPQFRASHVGNESGRVSPLEEASGDSVYYDPGSVSPLPQPTPYSEKSATSTNPLLGLGVEQRGMSDRVPEEMRPPPLKIRAVQDVDSRESMTSLPDLIRRATKLASNLDRGKTASRLGLLDMFGNNNHANPRKRESNLSDVLNSFPDPANATPTQRPRPGSAWPLTDKEAITAIEQQEQTHNTNPRSCCGLSVTSFLIILVIIILLIAASVLIPIFLIVIPRDQRSSLATLSNCPISRPCQNSGISIVDNNVCSCVCVNGYVGSDCSKSTDSNCVTANVVDGNRTFNAATLGSSIVSLISHSQGKLNIPINNTVLLSIFASNNLSCASENSLVQFGVEKVQSKRRSIVVHGLESDNVAVANIPVPPHPTQISTIKSIATRVARQAGIQTTNNIVYQATGVQSSATATTSQDSASAPSATSSTLSNPPKSKANITSGQLEFAQLVVLYVLAGSRAPSTAVFAQQNIEQYFRAGAVASGNATVNIGRMGTVDLTANFAQLAIIRSDGKIVGNSTQQ